MRYIFFATVLLFVAFGGEWFYLRYLRRVEPLGAQALALAEHFTRNGIQVQAHARRHGFRAAQMPWVAGYVLAGRPEPIVVEFCASDSRAEARLRAHSADPAVSQAARNGRLVLSLPRWSDEAAPTASAVLAAFAAFVPTEP